jgi:hypothetical protein
MAVPSLIHKAALTLFHNPHMQPEDVSVPYGDFSPYVTVIQRSWRRRTFLHRAATRINALLRAFRIRCFVQGFTPRNWLIASRSSRISNPATHSARARCVVVDATWVNTGGYLG